MAGDEIVADWLGDVYSYKVATAAGVLRFSNTSLRFKNVRITNMHGSGYAYIGEYNSSSSTFSTQKAFFLSPTDHINFEFVDLYELGYRQYTASIDLHVLGTNQY
jgi:hypothetical protein